MPLTPEEKVRVRDHLGYGNFSAASTFQFGTPAAVETAFLIEPAMNKLLPEAEGLFRDWLAKADSILGHLHGTEENAEADEVGEIKLNPLLEKRIAARYDFVVGKMANMLGVPVNPFDKTRGTIQGGGMNVRVR